MMSKDKFVFCRDKHKFSDIFPRETVVDNGYGFERGYKECLKSCCPKVVEMKREVWLDKRGRLVKSGPWKEDGGKKKKT